MRSMWAVSYTHLDVYKRQLWTFYLSETSDHLTKFREENYIVPEDTHHFFICGTNLMADILSDEYPAAIFLKWGPEIR